MILNGNCLELLPRISEGSIDSVVTDPPYGLSGMPDVMEMFSAWSQDREYSPGKSGFMGKDWDKFVPGPAVWKECLRVLKPGGYCLVFAGARTQDLMGLSLRMAGFEIRDAIAWLYGTGYPGGSSNVEIEGEKWGTRLKPSYEPVIIARKPGPLDGTRGRYNIDATRVACGAVDFEKLAKSVEKTREAGGVRGNSWGNSSDLSGANPASPLGRWPANVALDDGAAQLLDEVVGDRPGMSAGGKHSSNGDGMFGNTDGNKAHLRADNGGPSRFFYCAKASPAEREAGLDDFPVISLEESMGRVEGSSGASSPAAGAGRQGGRRNIHPTVKPVSLMEWLVKMVTPKGGLVLDPFAGSGSTGIACKRYGVTFIGMEQSAQYCAIAEARIEHDPRENP